MATADHNEERRLDNKIGKIKRAQRSIASMRAFSIGIPILLNAVGSHPPATLPMADTL